MPPWSLGACGPTERTRPGARESSVEGAGVIRGVRPVHDVPVLAGSPSAADTLGRGESARLGAGGLLCDGLYPKGWRLRTLPRAVELPQRLRVRVEPDRLMKQAGH